MFVVVWEPKSGGGHQVAMTLDRAEALHRAVCRAMPEATCRIEPVDGFGPGVEEPRQEPRPPRRRRVSGGRAGRQR